MGIGTILRSGWGDSFEGIEEEQRAHARFRQGKHKRRTAARSASFDECTLQVSTFSCPGGLI